MPLYEYQCPKCREVRELLRSMYDTDARECPECAVPMHKLISKSSFQLKGGGWYADGYCKRKEEKSTDNKTTDTPGCHPAGNKEPQTCQACNC